MDTPDPRQLVLFPQDAAPAAPQTEEKTAADIDADARAQVEAELHAAGIIEDPDLYGGLFG